MSNIQSAKLAYLLASCHKFNDSFMIAMVNQYFVAMRKYFTFYVTLYEPNAIDKQTQFAVKDVYFKFDGSDDTILKTAIQQYNNEVLDCEMTTIYNNLMKQSIDLDIYQLIGVYAIASLIKSYSGREKYSFVPIIIDYGRVSNMVHQTALIVDHERQTFIFYEPYGAYEKYGKSYRNCMQRFFTIFNDCGLFSIKGIEKSVIYHDLFNQTKGIQSIILEKNNLYADEFNASYQKTLVKLSANFPEYGLAARKSAIGDKDKNIKILDLMFHVERLGDIHMTNEKKALYNTLLYEILEQFYLYNAKTCVSITLIEMNEFFANNASKSFNDNTQENIERINVLYAEFDIDRPNKVLMQKIHNMVSIFSHSQYIRDTIDNNMQSFAICKTLFN